MDSITTLWIKTKFYMGSLLEFLCLIGVTFYTFVTLYSMIFLYAYLYSAYLVSFFLILFTIIGITGIFTGISYNIWHNRNNMQNEIWDTVLNDTQTVQVILNSLDPKQTASFLNQYDRLGNTALGCAMQSKNIEIIQIFAKKLSLKP